MRENGQTDELTDRLKKYGNTAYGLAKLELIESSSVISSDVITAVLIGSVIFLCILFSSFGVAYLLSSLLNSNYLGYLIVASFYFLLSLAMILARKKLLQIPFRNMIIRRFYSNDNDNSIPKII